MVRNQTITLFFMAFLLLPLSCRHTENQIRITIVTKAMDSEFWQSLRSGAMDIAKDYPDVQLSVLAPAREINIDQQVNILEDQILKRVSALVVAPCGVAEILPVLNAAHDKNIPVITVDTDIDWPYKLCYVGTDNRAGGQLAGEYLIEELNGKGKVALITGIPGVQTHEDRKNGFLRAIAKAPGIELIAQQPANSERELAMTVMENILTSNPHLDAVFMTSDQMALGAMEAIAAHNLADKIITVGFDAGKEAVQAVKDGRLNAVVAQNPYNMGKQAFLTALKIVNGEELTGRIDTGTELIEQSSVAQGSSRKELMIIAHRGGVVDEQRSENSFRALEEAIRRGYTHVEIDARITADGHVVCFHNDELMEETGIQGKISELPRDSLTQIVLTKSKETIPTFEEYCSRTSGRIGLMVDLKGCKDAYIDQYAQEIEAGLRKYGLLKDALILINKQPKNNQAKIVEHFKGKAKVSWRKSLLETQEAVGNVQDFAEKFYVFNHGADFTAEDVKGFQQLGLKVIVSINTGHYGTGDPQQQGEQHVQQMLEFGVDGLQIDSCYDPGYFAKKSNR
jgi:ribose transport system substrate-binding protein